MERAPSRAPEACNAPRRGQVCRRLRERGPPLILFLDTSALIKLFIEESGTSETQQAVQGAEAILAADLTYVEAHSALARMRVGKRLSATTYRAKPREVDDFWAGVASVEISTELLRSAAGLAARHALRAYDAVQLAAALSVRGAEGFAFACWDDELTAAARAEGLGELVP